MDKRIEEIEARLARATPGQWSWDYNGGEPEILSEKPIYANQRSMISQQFASDDDMQVMAHAPSDLSYLLSRVKCLEGAIEGALCECSSVAPVECSACHLRQQVGLRKKGERGGMNKNDVINMAAQSVIEAYEDAQESMSEADCIELLSRVIEDFSYRLRCLDKDAI